MTDKDHLILTAIGPDRVGLVQKISEFISHYGCNIEDSKMAVFCGEFAVIVLISGSGLDLDRIGGDYREIETATGLSVAFKTPSLRKAAEFFLPYTLTASCMDHPGVVHRISAALSSMGINIESMETKTYSAPESGTPLFRLEADLAVPARTNINRLRKLLEQLQEDENIDIEIAASKG